MAYKIYKRSALPQWWIDFGTHNGKRLRQSARTEDRKQAEEFAKHRQAELWRQEKLGGWASMAMVERYAHMTHERVAAVSGNIDHLLAHNWHTDESGATPESSESRAVTGRSWQARTADQRIKRAVDTRPGNPVFPRNIIDLETKNLGRKIPKQEKNSENVPRSEKNPAQIRHTK